MDRTALAGLIALILIVFGGIAASSRYRYTRPNTRDIRLIASGTIALVVILTVGVYILPPVTASPGTGSRNASNGSPSTPGTSSTQNHPPPSGSTTIKIAT